MSTSDTLRRAEARLREVAGSATSGPWEAAASGTVESPSGPVAEMYEGVYANAEADAAYIALMGPLVGLALADWLRVAADGLARRGVTAHIKPAEAAALALALRVLGEEG